LAGALAGVPEVPANTDNMASVTAEWFDAHHVMGYGLRVSLLTAAVYIGKKASRSVRLWFIGTMAAVAIIGFAAIYFLP
jgi:hypothetical protein